ncbi:MAG: dTDP-4-dehydrorhamnose 3,5-epimerase [Candidatus Absconditabacteria bacterium]|nr:dTDP-4-dehydrorhamnose 3,5-epimerase [Candidatus Absconditabacteria bacterium]
MGFSFEKNSLIEDVVLITPQVFGDQRGFFMESHNQKDFVENGISSVFVQDNHSKSSKGVLRGFHFQTQNTQAKLVRVFAGSVLDFAIDLRKNSQTFGKYIMEVLSAENKKQLFVPKGFAHGFLTLEDNTEFVYKCDDYYNPKADGGILYSDPDLNIDREKIQNQYDIQEFILADKDKKQPKLKEFLENNPF